MSTDRRAILSLFARGHFFCAVFSNFSSGRHFCAARFAGTTHEETQKGHTDRVARPFLFFLTRAPPFPGPLSAIPLFFPPHVGRAERKTRAKYINVFAFFFIKEKERKKSRPSRCLVATGIARVLFLSGLCRRTEIAVVVAAAH